jgi:thiol-disulfide isomerase/thioredoxin
MVARIFGRHPTLSVEGHLPTFEGATGWLNSTPLTPEGLLGKVVAVDFCTYTCINWLRTLPYVRAWAEKYAGHGLVTIGVHTPEFSFEHDAENVRRALASMRVAYPIELDNDYGVWNAFTNHYWPALYLADAEGRLRHHWFGEGDYEGSEMVIQMLLAEAGHEGFERQLVKIEGEGPEAPADWDDLRSGETYLGYRQAQGFRSPGGAEIDRGATYRLPDDLGLNEWALAGDWTISGEAATSDAPGGRIALRFHARDVHLVMGPASREMPVPFRVTIDGQPPGRSRGTDIAEDGAGSLVDQRMYQLIRQDGPIDDRTFEIELLDRGAEAFAFTFG